jgi:Flp pilus assembly protein TadD
MSTAADHRIKTSSTFGRIGILAVAAATLSLGGCAGAGGDMMAGLLAKPGQPATDTAQADTGGTELEKATQYWAREFASKPTDLRAALSYARNLKALGQKSQAMAVLQQSSSYHGQSRELASEYGRLALEMGQVATAKPLLDYADDPAKPDWRVISARGTVLAKEGSYKAAIPFFERAVALSNSHPSVMNNLAMAHALAGEPDRSETILRQAASKGGPAKVRQNLALVLGLQGKYDEATVVAAKETGQTVAQNDTAVVRQLVGLEPKAMPVPQAAVQLAATPPATMRPQQPGAPAAAQLAAAPLKGTAQPGPAATGSWQPQVAVAEPAQTPSLPLKGAR